MKRRSASPVTLKSHGLRYKVTALLMVLALMVPILAACSDDDPETPTSQPTLTTPAATTPVPTATTPTPAETGPVKIGVICAWSGAAAMMGSFFVDPIIKTVEKQVADMGGILGGRPVKFITGDSANNVAGAISAAQKLLTQDKVSVLTVGGASPAEMVAMMDVAENNKILYVTPNAVEIDNLKYTIESTMALTESYEEVVGFITKVATPKPQTVGILSWNMDSSRDLIAKWKQGFEAAGVKVVYDQYPNPGVVDFSPYLTSLKRANPDYLVVNLGASEFIAIGKQMLELGGWGNIKVLCEGTASSAAGQPGTEGWIVIAPWSPLLNDPASVKFKEDFQAANGTLPMDFHVYMYNTMWVAIKAIELAGTDDREAVAKAARSGNLVVDTPMGTAHITTNGHTGLKQIYLRIQDGKLVPVSSNP